MSLLLLLLSITLTQLLSAVNCNEDEFTITGKCFTPAFTKSPAAKVEHLIQCIASCKRDTECIGIHHSPTGDCTHVTLQEYLRHWSSDTSCSGVTFVMHQQVIDASQRLSLSNCQQSSLYPGGLCGRAIDGNTNTIYGGNSCCHTALPPPEPHPWWQADTEAVANITAVVIFNRSDSCCKFKLGNFEIRVDGTVCAEFVNAAGFDILGFMCVARGRTVKVQSRISEGLHFCEIYVYGRL